MMRKVAVVGASIGGLVAAAELRERGFDITIIEKGQIVGGLYGKVETPFGTQELGMHVLYVTQEHYRHLCNIFGADAFHTWQGYAVDIGASHNFGKNFFDSIYPDVRGLSTSEKIVNQLIEKQGAGYSPSNALEAVIGRFGEEAGINVFAPILKKLWKMDANQLSKDAIHCFYDLRRVVACDKARADQLKQDTWLDSVIANPLQSQPSGTVFDGRIAVRFKNTFNNTAEKALQWLSREKVSIQFERSVEIVGRRLIIDGTPIDEIFDGCIVATPLASLIPEASKTMDSLDLSIYYFKLVEKITNNFPAYYLLCHDSNIISSRIVNYDAYNVEDQVDRPIVIAVEVTHLVGNPPTLEDISSELATVLPFATISESYKLPASLRVPIPSLKNASILDEHTEGMVKDFPNEALFFTGMRTDKGIFFSHHTIGQAYESALECATRLS